MEVIASSCYLATSFRLSAYILDVLSNLTVIQKKVFIKLMKTNQFELNQLSDKLKNQIDNSKKKQSDKTFESNKSVLVSVWSCIITPNKIGSQLIA